MSGGRGAWFKDLGLVLVWGPGRDWFWFGDLGLVLVWAPGTGFGLGASDLFWFGDLCFLVLVLMMFCF